MLPGKCSGDVFPMLRVGEQGLFPRGTILVANSPARPRPATPPCAPTQPARGMSGFGTRQVYLFVPRHPWDEKGLQKTMH